MVVTTQHYATEVGAKVLREGGNAIDAAVAVGYALAVVHPCCGNIGGGGFMMIHTAKGVNTFIDFRERAPLAATATMYLNADGTVDAKKSVDGYLSVGHAGLGGGAGVRPAQVRHACLGPLLLGPSIAPGAGRLSCWRPRTPSCSTNTPRRSGPIRRRPAIFLKDGQPLKPGDRLVQADLAGTLSEIATGGEAAFYRGPIARQIVAASARQRRPADPRRLRRLHGGGAGAGLLPLSRAHRAPAAAAQLGRRDHLRDVRHPFGLRRRDS